MKKITDFASSYSLGWPSPKELEHYFLGPPGRRWFFEDGNDAAALRATGADGTDHLG